MKDPGRRKRRQPAEVVASLRQAGEALAAGKPIAEVARSLGVAPATLRRLRKEYGTADRDAIRRLKELEKENARPKRLSRAEGLLVVLDELLSSELFEPLTETRCLVDRRRVHYSRRRPQWALGKLTPAAFAAACPAPPPFRLAALACAAASPDTQGAGTMLTLSQGVDR